MKDFSIGRWLAGGIVAGLVVWILEGALSALYVQEMSVRMNEMGLATEVSAAHFVGAWIYRPKARPQPG